MQLLIGGTRAAYVGPGLNLSPHTNAVCTLAISLGAALDVRLMGKKGVWGEWKSTWAARVPAGALHHIKADSNSTLLFVYLDPQLDRLQNFTDSELNACRESLCKMDLSAATMLMIEHALGLPDEDAAHPRLNTVIRAIENNPGDFDKIEDAAKLINLSGSRFRALFKSEVGIPFRRYRLWRRMAHVVKAVSNGKSLTHAGADAGFSDSAHLSASFKSMFGITPSFLLHPALRIHCAESPATPVWRAPYRSPSLSVDQRQSL